MTKKFATGIVAGIALLVTLPATGAPGIITTIAGTGAPGYCCDGMLATSAWLSVPRGMALDSAGNLFFGDSMRIRKVSTDGIIGTVAGSGQGGFAGDNGPATSALLNDPRDVAVDSAGNIFIADTSNHRIRKVTSSGIIGTVAGGGIGFSGDGGPATSAGLSNPSGIAVDAAGNLYISDSGNNRIRKVDSTGTITTIAGNGSCYTGSDSGPATESIVCDPRGIALDASGNLYIAQRANHRIRKLTPSGTITTIAGNGYFAYSGDGGPATSASLYEPHSVAVDSAGLIYIADGRNYRIRKIDTAGIISTVAGFGTYGYSGDGGPATSATMAEPLDVVANPAGDIFISDSMNHRIRKVGSRRTRGDANGDGTADLYWRTAPPGSGLSWWLMKGGTLQASNYFEVESSWQIVDVGDFNGDARADIVWRRSSDGATYLWTLDGLVPTGFFSLGALSPLNWSFVGAADLNGDGKADLIWRSTSGIIYGWLMNGDEISSQGVISYIDPPWSIADLADMNGDGKADLVFRHSVSGEVYVWNMNGLAVTGMGSAGSLDPAIWELVAAADFDVDGKADLLWRHASGDTWVSLMNGTTTLASASIGNPGQGWSIVSVADLDGVGRSGIVWRHTDGTSYFWRMNGLFVTGFVPLPDPGSDWRVTVR